MEDNNRKEAADVAAMPEEKDNESSPQKNAEATDNNQEEHTEVAETESSSKDASETDAGQTTVNTYDAYAAQQPAAYTPSIYDWTKQFDPSSGYFYYYNYRTGATQWEMPEGFVETPQAAAYSYGYPQYPMAATSSYDTSMVATASFNSKTGSFNVAGAESHYAKMGRATDRETRQMSAFFDMSTLDANREEAKRKKKQLQEAKGIDWRKYKEEKKKKRQKISHKWLYEDD